MVDKFNSDPTVKRLDANLTLSALSVAYHMLRQIYQGNMSTYSTEYHDNMAAIREILVREGKLEK